MGEWRTDPTFAMCRALVDGAELLSFAGGPFDVRAVVAAIRPEAKDAFLGIRLFRVDSDPGGRLDAEGVHDF